MNVGLAPTEVQRDYSNEECDFSFWQCSSAVQPYCSYIAINTAYSPVIYFHSHKHILTSQLLPLLIRHLALATRA